MASTPTFPNDPRALSLAERRAFWHDPQMQQQQWLEQLRRLAEPAIADDFPAFLLSTPAFANLAVQLRAATGRADLSLAALDPLDHFIDAYRDYLRSADGEDVFGNRRAS